MAKGDYHIQVFPDGERREFRDVDGAGMKCVEHIQAEGDKRKSNLIGHAPEQMPDPHYRVAHEKKRAEARKNSVPL